MIENPLQFKYSIDVCNEAIQFLINQSMGFSIHEFVDEEDEGDQSLSAGVNLESEITEDESELYFEDILSDYTQDEEKETEAENEIGIYEDVDKESSEYTNETEGDYENDIDYESDEFKDNSESEDDLAYEVYEIESNYEEYDDGEDETYDIESESEDAGENYIVGSEETEAIAYEVEDESEDMSYEIEDESDDEECDYDDLNVDSNNFDNSEDKEYDLDGSEDGEESDDIQEYIEDIEETYDTGRETTLEEVESDNTDGYKPFVTDGYSVDLDSGEDVVDLEQDNYEVMDTSEKDSRAELEEKKKKLAYLKKLLAIKEVQEKEALSRKAVEQDVDNESESDEKIYRNTNELYKDVKEFMLSKGVDKKPISSDILTAEFGEKNIRELRLKSYIIKIGSGFTIGL